MQENGRLQINRAETKLHARQVMREAKPNVIFASLIYVLLAVVVGTLSLRLTGVSSETLSKMMELSENGNMDAAINMMMRQMPGPGPGIIDLLLRVALRVVEIGFVLFTMNMVRKTGAEIGNLLDGFGMLPRLLLLLLLEYILISLWSLLFIIPGIVASYRYRFAVYLLLDHPEMSPVECLRESKRMTYGYKWQLFTLDLSFLLWILASGIPLIGYAIRVYATPYFETTRVLYYEQIRLYTPPQVLYMPY